MLNTNNFIIKSDTILEGYGFETSLGELAESVDILNSDEYVINWYESDMEIYIESIEADGMIIWEYESIDMDDWTYNHDELVEGLMGYIESNVV